MEAKKPKKPRVCGMTTVGGKICVAAVDHPPDCHDFKRAQRAPLFSKEDIASFGTAKSATANKTNDIAWKEWTSAQARSVATEQLTIQRARVARLFPDSKVKKVGDLSENEQMLLQESTGKTLRQNGDTKAETIIGWTEFKTLEHGSDTLIVETDGLVYRYINVFQTRTETILAALSPAAARDLAQILNRAADVADYENKQLENA